MIDKIMDTGYKIIVASVAVVGVAGLFLYCTTDTASAADEFQQDLDDWTQQKIQEWSQVYGNYVDPVGQQVWDIIARQSELAIQDYQTVLAAQPVYTGIYGILQQDGTYIYYPCTLYSPYKYTGQNVGQYVSAVIATSPHFTIRGVADIAVSTNNPDNYLYVSGLPNANSGGFIVNSVDWARPCITGYSCSTNFFSTTVRQYSDGAYFALTVNAANSPPGFNPSDNGVPGTVCGAPHAVDMPVVSDTPDDIAANDTPEKYFDNTLRPYLEQIAETYDIPQQWIYNGTTPPEPTQPMTDPPEPATVPYIDNPFVIPEPVTEIVLSGDTTEIVVQTETGGSFARDWQIPSISVLDKHGYSLDDVETDLDIPTAAANVISDLWELVRTLLDGAGLFAFVPLVLTLSAVLYILSKIGG